MLKTTRLIAYCAALATALVVCAVASATPGDDAVAAATQYLTALSLNDGQTACKLTSARVVELYGGIASCVDSGSGKTAADETADANARSYLTMALSAARAEAAAHSSGYPTGDALVKAIRQRNRRLRVISVSSPTQMRNQSAQTVGVSRNSSRSRVVFYAESNSGKIWQLAASTSSAPAFRAVAEGVAAPRPPTTAPQGTFTVGTPGVAGDTVVYVPATLKDATTSVNIILPLVYESGAWKVDGVFVDIFSFTGALVSAGK